MIDCLDWLDKCKASCCRSFTLSIPPHAIIKDDKILKMQIVLDADMKRYHNLHDNWFMHGVLYSNIGKNYKVDRKKGTIRVFRDCIALRGNLCVLHPDKPKCCIKLNEQTKHKFNLTENCRFKSG